MTTHLVIPMAHVFEAHVWSHLQTPALTRLAPQLSALNQPVSATYELAHEAMLRGLHPNSDTPRTVAQLTLCHFQSGLDQMRLVAGPALAVTAAESAALLDAASAFLTEDGIAVQAQASDAAVWLAQGDVWQGVQSASLLRARTGAVQPWMLPHTTPTDDTAPRPHALLARLQSELQMLWHDHPVNQAREAAGQLPINGWWVQTHFAQPSATNTALVVADALIEPALHQDPHAWLTAWAQIDAIHVALLQQGDAITLCGADVAQTFVLRLPSFWQRVNRAMRPSQGITPMQVLQRLDGLAPPVGRDAG